MHWIDTVPLQAAHTATSWLDTRDEGLGSGSLAVNIQESAAADPTVPAQKCTSHSDHSLGKRRTMTASMEAGCGSLPESAHKEARFSLNHGECTVRTVHARMAIDWRVVLTQDPELIDWYP